MKTNRTPSQVSEINRLHAEVLSSAMLSRSALYGGLNAAWRAGTMMLAEKKRVRRVMGVGAWLFWLEANFNGTPRTAQRYMLLAKRVEDVTRLNGLSLRQVYVHLGIATESKSAAHSGRCPTLPPHLVLANRLVRDLQSREKSVSAEQAEAYRRDLRQLYERLRSWFEPLTFSSSAKIN